MIKLPGHKRFAFSIVDDTDVSTLANVRPVYDCLDGLGLRTTKTVWMRRSLVPSKNFFRSETMEDGPYRDYVLELHAKGFEIASHGASMESSPRDFTIECLEAFETTFGAAPRLHVNHAENRDNVYWGVERFRSPILRAIQRVQSRRVYGRSDYFQGHVEDSPYFWGDLCRRHVTYVRNFCYDRINVLNVCPSMPYHVPGLPYVRLWFAALDAPDAESFVKLLTSDHIDRLEREGGVCIVATHFGKRFVRDGQVLPEVRRVFQSIAARDVWCAPVSEILDHLRGNGAPRDLTRSELSRMEWHWMRYKLGNRNYRK